MVWKWGKERDQSKSGGAVVDERLSSERFLHNTQLLLLRLKPSTPSSVK